MQNRMTEVSIDNKFLTDNYFNKLEQIAIQYVHNNYNYCYLKAMHEKNREIGTSTIVVGSSHAMNGVVEELFPNEDVIYFSISSQDLYCDFLHIKKAIREGKKQIRRCIINMGYYMLFQDISLSRQMNYLMPTVYGPLFDDMHHYVAESSIDFLEKIEYEHSVYSEDLIRKICQEWSNGAFIEQGSYYGKLLTREQNNILSIHGVMWPKKDNEEKNQYALKRAADHNKLRKHELSRLENDKIVRDMVEFLEKHEIRPIFVIFPFTQWYRKYIDSFYKKDIFELLNSLPQQVELLDMNEIDGFNDEDFLDTDHLSLRGAEKATRLLVEFIKIEQM